MNSLMKEIQARRRQMSKGQLRIAAFITDHYEQAAFMTAAKLGEAAHVSESTVVRFAYALGLTSSVLPTPVGPVNRKLMGRRVLPIPARRR